MKRKIAKLEPEKRKHLSPQSSFARRWEIVNPTNTPLRFVGRNGEGAYIRPTPTSSLNRKKLYFYLAYKCTPSANPSFPNGLEEYIGSERGEDKVVLSTDLEEIINAPHGLYIEQLDIVIGRPEVTLQYPQLEMPDLQIHNEETVIYQYFISVKDSQVSNVYTELDGAIARVQVLEANRPPGLYTMISDVTGIRLKLLNPSPLYANSEKELLAKMEKERDKVKPITHESIDVSKFNQFISSINKQTTTESSRVDNELDEEFKIRDLYRKDSLDELKTNRTARNESTKQTNEAIKAFEAASNTLSKAFAT